MIFKFSGTIKYPNLQPPAPHHLLKPVLIIVFSGQKFEIDLKLSSKLSSEYISSDKIIKLYFLAISLISSKFSQILPDGILGEFKNNK